MRYHCLALTGLMLTFVAGCCEQAPPVQRVPVPAPGSAADTRAAEIRRTEWDQPRPMPEQRMEMDMAAAPPFDDIPLVNQRTPEQTRFEQAYRGVNRPRITVFVNRSLDGAAIPSGNDGTMEVNRRSEERRAIRPAEDAPATGEENNTSNFRSTAFDEAFAKSIDYEAMENILTDFLACQGAVEIISPTAVRQKLSDEQLRDLQSGKARALKDLGQQVEADILVQVWAKPTRQTRAGLEIRLVGEAMNIKGGQQIGRAVVDVPPPLEKTALNKYTRYVSRKLMMDMTQAWIATEPAPENRQPRGPETAPKSQP